jgi:hypothetical protein
MQLIAFVNLKSKEGLFVADLFRVEGPGCLLLSDVSHVYGVYYRCRSINPDQENANAMPPLLYAVHRAALCKCD